MSFFWYDQSEHCEGKMGLNILVERFGCGSDRFDRLQLAEQQPQAVFYENQKVHERYQRAGAPCSQEIHKPDDKL